jgi:hypothetical protein
MSDEPVIVRTFLNTTDAEMARSALEAAGITSVVRSDDCGGMRPHLWMGGVALLVPAAEAEAAASFLDELESQVAEAPDEPDDESEGSDESNR